MRKRLFLTIALVLAATTANAQYDDAIRRLEAFIEAHLKATGTPGISVAVKKGDFVYAKGFGYADLENKVPATAESSYRMASVTKPMTAAAVMKLVERGKIDLDAEVQKYVPYFPKKGHPITVRQLLGHLGGISHYRDYDAEGHFRDPKSTREAVAVFEKFDLVAEPGTRYEYSSYGYNLLGAVIEGATGRSYGEVMRDEIWKPLGMTSTRMDDPRDLIPNRVRGYISEGGKLRNSEYVDISSRFAAGGTRSTVRDMVTFITSLEKVLKPETIEAMWTGGVTRDGNASRYGYGFALVPRAARFTTGHNGGQPETATELVYLPREDFAVALGVNYENSDVGAIAARIQYFFLGDHPHPSYYVPAKSEQLTLQATGVTWNNGLAWYDRFGKVRAKDENDLNAAFRYFNESVKAADAKRIGEGRHPAGGEAFIKVGAAMAAHLAKSGADLDKYHREGDLVFFDDYIRLYRANRSIPKTQRFDPAFEALVGRWREEWVRSVNEEVRLFILSSPADLDRLEKELAPRFANASIRPGFQHELTGLGETAAQDGDFSLAARIAKLGLSLYPEAENTTGFAGVLAVASGDVERGKALLLKSRSIDPNGYAGAENLKNIADVLEKMGNKAAADVLRGL